MYNNRLCVLNFSNLQYYLVFWCVAGLREEFYTVVFFNCVVKGKDVDPRHTQLCLVLQFCGGIPLQACMFSIIIATFQSAKCASEAPLVRTLVVTSLYERPFSVQTLEEGEARFNVTCYFGCSQLIGFIYLLRSISHPNWLNQN